MKLTKIEKSMLLGMLAIIFIIAGFNYIIYSVIESHGGVKASIIEAGKEAKDIAKEIEKP